jgi:hypothetical protein
LGLLALRFDKPSPCGRDSEIALSPSPDVHQVPLALQPISIVYSDGVKPINEHPLRNLDTSGVGRKYQDYARRSKMDVAFHERERGMPKLREYPNLKLRSKAYW